MIKALFLLAGSGSRLKPLTDTKPKSLIEINGKTLLGRSIDYLIANQVKSIVIVTGYMHNAVHSFIKKNYPQLSVEFINNDLYDSTNNSYSLYLAQNAFIGSGMILLDGDILYDKRILDQILKIDSAKNVLAVRKSNDLAEEEMKVILDESNIVRQIEKRLNPDHCFGESLGIAKFSKQFTEKLFTVLTKRMIKEQRINEFYEASFQELIDQGEQIEILNTGEYKCCEIDTIADLNFASEKIAPLVDN